MKYFLVFLFCLNTKSDLKLVREYYLAAYNNKDYALKLKKSTELKSDAITQAYYGASLTFLAKHSINPYKKLSYLNEGLKNLNAAVIWDTTNVEVRFLRFSTEENIPGFIPFTSHTKTDKLFLLKNVNVNHPIYKTMYNYIQQSKMFTKEEKSRL